MPTSNGRIVDTGRSNRTRRFTSGGATGASGTGALTGGFASLLVAFTPWSLTLRTCSGEYEAIRRCGSPPLLERSTGELLVSNGGATIGSANVIEELDVDDAANMLLPLLRLSESKAQTTSARV